MDKNITLFMKEDIILTEYNNENTEFDSYREEYEILQEEEKKKEDKKDDSSKAEKAKDIAKEILRSIKDLHTSDEDELLNHSNKVSKIITRAVISGSLIALRHPLIGLLTFLTGSVIKSAGNAGKRKKLLALYKSKLEFVEDKLGRVEDDKEKYELIKLKNELKSNIKKIQLVN